MGRTALPPHTTDDKPMASPKEIENHILSEHKGAGGREFMALLTQGYELLRARDRVTEGAVEATKDDLLWAFAQGFHAALHYSPHHF